MRAFVLVLPTEAARQLADTQARAGEPTRLPVSDGQVVVLAVPGDRVAVYERLYDAVGVWLVRTPQIQQSAASLSRFLMTALEAGEIPQDGPSSPVP